jgi:hypothetical protein
MKRFKCSTLILRMKILLRPKTNVEAFAQLVALELDTFQQCHVDVDNYKYMLSWWHVEEHKFPAMAMLA